MSQTAANTTLRARTDNDALFMAALKDTGNVTVACAAAGFDRSHVYKRKTRDKPFREAWEDALETSIDKLELVARNRAVEGAKRQLYYKGEPCGVIYEPSDRLMELLLKAHRPDKFNPVQKMEHSGSVAVSVIQFGGQDQGVVIEHDSHGDGQGDQAEEGQPIYLDDDSESQGTGSVPDSVAHDDADSLINSSTSETGLDSLDGDMKDGGGVSEGLPPKSDGAENDEPCHVAKFSNLDPD